MSQLNQNSNELLQQLQQRVQELENEVNHAYASNKLLKAIFDLLPAWIFWKDTNNNILGFNRAYQQAVGYTAEELLSTSGYDLFPDGEKYHLDDLRVVESGQPRLNIEETVVLPNGKTVWFRTDKVPYYNADGEIIGIIGISIDLTLQKETEAALREAKKALQKANDELEQRVEARTHELMTSNQELRRINTDLDNFIYTASHDLKTPIANFEGLIGLLGGLLLDKLGQEEKEIFDMVNVSIEQFKKTINDLAEITKVQKQLDEEREQVTFGEIFEDVYTDLHNMIVASGAQIQTDFQVSHIHYARKNLRSIIYNLLSNAVKYASPERKPLIYIGSHRSAQGICMTVKDNGLGIKKNQQDKLFKMFRRLHTHVDGTGIGLYIVKRIIENNGGKIELESEENQGATFKVFFESLSPN